VLTFALVLVNGYYAWEMRVGRHSQMMPKLVITRGPRVEKVEGAGEYVYVANVGPGHAFDIDVQLGFEPKGIYPWRLRCAFIGSGKRRKFRRPELTTPAGDAGIDLRDLGTVYKAVRLRGRCRDAFGKWREVDHRMTLREGWEAILPNDPSRLV